MNEDVSGLPLYRRIYQDLAGKIATGELRYREMLPPLPALCRLYGVSESPVRRALDDLARESLIIKRRGRGKGTVVTGRPVTVTIRVLLLTGFNVQKSRIETCHEVFDLLAGIEAAAREFGGRVQQVSPGGFDVLPPVGPATGYLLIGMSQDDYRRGADLASRHGVPSVLVNPPSSGGTAVRVDMEHGASLAVDSLAMLGHRRIAYVGGTRGEWFTPRLKGYRQALAANGLRADEALLRESDGVSPEQDGQALEALWALPDPPTAIFAASDYRALHLLAHCRQKKIPVPQQLSICGYDDIREVAGVEPAMTTIHHPRQELGRMAVEMLTDLLCDAGDGGAPTDRVVKPHLVIRASCAPPTRRLDRTRPSGER